MTANAIEAVAAASRGAREAAEIHSAVARMMVEVHYGFDLLLGVFGRYVDGGRARVLAAWAPFGEFLDPGDEVSWASTEELVEVDRLLRSGRTAVVDLQREDLGLLSDLLAALGARWGVGIPVPRDGTTFGVIGFVFGDREGLGAPTEEEVRLLQALVAGTQDHLIGLAEHDPGRVDV